MRLRNLVVFPKQLEHRDTRLPRPIFIHLSMAGSQRVNPRCRRPSHITFGERLIPFDIAWPPSVIVRRFRQPHQTTEYPNRVSLITLRVARRHIIY